MYSKNRPGPSQPNNNNNRSDTRPSVGAACQFTFLPSDNVVQPRNPRRFLHTLHFPFCLSILVVILVSLLTEQQQPSSPFCRVVANRMSALQDGQREKLMRCKWVGLYGYNLGTTPRCVASVPRNNVNLNKGCSVSSLESLVSINYTVKKKEYI